MNGRRATPWGGLNPARLAAYKLYRSAVPYWLRNLIDVRRKSERIRKRGVLLIHIPKNAGSSLAMALYGKHIGHYPLTAYELAVPCLIKDCEILAIYRDPVDRFFSAFNYARFGGGSRSPSRAARNDVVAYDDVNSFALSIKSPADLWALDVIFWPQTYFISDKQVVKYGVSLYGIEYCNDLINVVTRASNLASEEPVARNEGMGDRQVSYTDKARRHVEFLYHSDYTLEPLVIRE